MKHEEFKWLKEKIGEEKTEELLFKTRQAIWSALLGNGSIGDEKDSSNTRAEMIWDMAQDILSGVEDALASSEKKEDLEKITNIMLANINKRLEAKGLSLVVPNDVVDYIVAKGSNLEYGARPLRRFIEQEIEDRIAEKLLLGELKEKGKIEAVLDDGHLDFKMI